MPAHGRRPGEAGRGGRGIRSQVGGTGPAAVGGPRPAGGLAARPVGGRTSSRGGARSRRERAESAADGQHGARVPAGRQVAAAQRPVPRVRDGRVGRRRRWTAAVVVVATTAAAYTAGGHGAAPAGARRQTAGAPFLRARRPGRHPVQARIAPDFPVVAQADVRIPAGNDVVVPVRAVAGRAGRRRTGTGVGQATRHAGAVCEDRGARAQADDDDDDDDRGRRPGATLAGNRRRRRRKTSSSRSAVGSAAHGGGRPTVPGPDTAADGRGRRRGGARADRFAETVVRDVRRVRRQESAAPVRFVAGPGNRGPAGASVFRAVRPVGRGRRPAADAGPAGRDDSGSGARHRGCPRRGRVVLARRPRAPRERRAPRPGHRAPGGRLPESGGPSAVGRRAQDRFGRGETTVALRRQARDVGGDRDRRPAAAARDDGRFVDDVAVVAAKVL